MKWVCWCSKCQQTQPCKSCAAFAKDQRALSEDYERAIGRKPTPPPVVPPVRVAYSDPSREPIVAFALGLFFGALIAAACALAYLYPTGPCECQVPSLDETM